MTHQARVNGDNERAVRLLLRATGYHGPACNRRDAARSATSTNESQGGVTPHLRAPPSKKAPPTLTGDGSRDRTAAQTTCRPAMREALVGVGRFAWLDRGLLDDLLDDALFDRPRRFGQVSQASK